MVINGTALATKPRSRNKGLKGASRRTRRLTRAKAIRAKCLDCSCYQRNEVRLCPVTDCALWPYRHGRGYEELPQEDLSPDSDFDSERKRGQSAVDFSKESPKRYPWPHERVIVEKQAGFQPSGRRVDVTGLQTDADTGSGMKRVQDGR